MRKKNDVVQKTYYLPKELVKAIEDQAALGHRTLSAEMTLILTRYFKSQQENNQAAINLAVAGSLRQTEQLSPDMV